MVPSVIVGLPYCSICSIKLWYALFCRIELVGLTVATRRGFLGTGGGCFFSFAVSFSLVLGSFSFGESSAVSSDSSPLAWLVFSSGLSESMSLLVLHSDSFLFVSVGVSGSFSSTGDARDVPLVDFLTVFIFYKTRHDVHVE